MNEIEKDYIDFKDENGNIKKAEVVLYFKLGEKKVMIYTFNETDSNGMIILYSSIVEKQEDGRVNFSKISQEDWADVKKVMNKIVKEWSE